MKKLNNEQQVKILEIEHKLIVAINQAKNDLYGVIRECLGSEMDLLISADIDLLDDLSNTLNDLDDMGQVITDINDLIDWNNNERDKD